MTSDLLNAAIAWGEAGAAVLPICSDGSKRPGIRSQAHAWSRYRSPRPSRALVRAWFTMPDPPGLGIATGDYSGGIEMAELEGRCVTEGGMEHLVTAARWLGAAELLDRVAEGYIEATPSGGIHILWRVEGRVPGNIKLAARYARPEELTDEERAKMLQRPNFRPTRVLAETRGTGGFTVLAPTGGTVHPSGRPWAVVCGGPGTLVTITPSERERLLEAFRALNTVVQAEEGKDGDGTGASGRSSTRTTTSATRKSANGKVTDQRTAPPSLPLKTPADDFEQLTDWADPLLLGGLGWTEVGQQGRTRFWRHPAASHQHSATTGRDPHHDRLFVFSSSTPFQTERPYSKFAAFCEIEGVDFREGGRRLRRLGFGGAR